VFWAHASNTVRLEQSFRNIADQVKVRGHKDPQADVFKLVHDWLRNKKNGQWLLVLDNADDANVLSPSPSNGQSWSEDNITNSGTSGGSSSSALQQHLSTYLPPSAHGSVLVTSRTRRAAMQIVDDSDILPVEPMHDSTARALLYKKLGDKVDKSDGIAELASVLEYMPLALVQAAAFIRERAPRSTVQQYLTEYRESDNRKTSLLNRAAGHLRRDKAASNSVLLTWQISFEHIRSSRRSAADLLSLMSFFDRQGIQEALLRNPDSTTDNDNFEDDVLTLRDYSFITVTKEANTFEMHNLVQLATRTWLGTQGQLHKWQARFISNLCVEMPTGQHENWQKWQVLFPHAKAALAQRPQDKDSLRKWALVLYQASCYALEQGKAGDAEHMSTLSMKVRQEAFGEESAETLSSMEVIGQAKILRGEYEEAGAILGQTLALRETVLGREHPCTLASMSSLALALDRQGKYDEAEAMNRQTLALRETMLGLEHPDTLMSMRNLAQVLMRQGKYEEAEAMNRQTLALTETVLGCEHPDTLASMGNLAQVLMRQGKYDEAEAILRQTLALTETVLGREHPETLMTRGNLAGVLISQRTYGDVEAMSRQTLALYKTVFGCEHPETLTSMSNLALVLIYQGKYEEADAMSRQTLALRETVLGHEHPDTLTSMSNLVGVLEGQGKYEEAEAMNRKTLALTETVLGREHPCTLTSMGNLALVLGRQGKYEEAEAIFRQTLALRETVLGLEHPDTLMSMYCLADFLAQLRYYPESLALYERTYAGYQVVFGSSHPITWTCGQHYATARVDATNLRTGALALATPDSNVVVHTRKVSKLVSWLAKLGGGSSKISSK
jgi:tetratricopeptide (TPR) repeat protein